MFPRRKKQSGNLYIVAIFVIVVMGFLAAAITRMDWSNQDSLSRELLGTKAWFAANSVNEKALTFLYPLNATSSAVSSACGVWGRGLFGWVCFNTDSNTDSNTNAHAKSNPDTSARV